MNQLTPVELGVAFVNAFGRADMRAVAGYVADDIVFTSPRARIKGVGPYLEAVGQFARTVTAVRLIASYGDDHGAMVMYDMETGPFGPIRAVDHLVIHEGRIHVDNLVFDTYEVRKAQGASVS